MGWADLLVRLGIPYSSDEGVEMARRTMSFIDEEARQASERLAESRGVFPAWEASIWGLDPARTAATTCAAPRPSASESRGADDPPAPVVPATDS